MTFLNPSKVIDKLDIRPGMKVSEFGCGAGHFSIEMAKRVGKQGVVYAFDVRQEPLGVLKSRAESENLFNIETGQVDLEAEDGTHLNSEILDLVLISNLFFQNENKSQIAKEAFRVLKGGGKTVVIEWNPSTSSELGPSEEARVDKETLTDIFAQADFRMDREIEVGDKHYGLIFIKHEA